MAHAYLFTGPAHIGKTRLAKTFAQALCCETSLERSGVPCGHCRACRLIDADHYQDVQIIQAGGDADDGEVGAGTAKAGKKNTMIKRSQIEALQHEVALSPYEGRYKVYIILEAESMNAEAANLLLKTLEEPPNKVIMLLTATDASMLLPTVVSRCQQLALHPLPVAAIKRALIEKHNVEASEANRIAHISRGRIGWAINAVSHPNMLAQRTTLLERLNSASNGSKVQRFKLVEKLVSEYSGNQAGLQGALGLWLEWWRDVLLMKIGCQEMVANLDQLELIKKTAERLSVASVYAFTRELQATLGYLEANVNARLALEALMLKLPTGEASFASRRW
jgi:DNA polymerase-3 subunit delta'